MKVSTSTVVLLAGIVAGSSIRSTFKLQPEGKRAAESYPPRSSSCHSETDFISDIFLDAVTATQFSDFTLFAQYAGAAYCSNNDDDTGGLITCANDVCPTVESNAAQSIVEFTGYVKISSRTAATANHLMSRDAKTNQEGFVAIDPVESLIVVSLRGSDSVVNYIDDVLFLYTSCDFIPGGKVHTGFWNNWLASQSTIVSAVENATAAYPTYSLVVTGHSLGAAVATIAAAYLRENGYPCDLYTYGSPRVGNGVFADFVSNQTGVTARITHWKDVVPRLPPLLIGYRHTSPEYWLSDGTDTTNNYTASDIVVCVGDKNTTCNAGERGLDIIAHLHYFENISTCASSILRGKRAISLTWETQLVTFGDLDAAYFNALAQTTATAESTIQLTGDVVS